MKRKQRLTIKFVAYAAAGFMGFCMIAFLAFAGYLALLRGMLPLQAALLTAAALLAAAILIPLVARATTRLGERRRPVPSTDRLIDSLEAMLDSRANPALSAWVRRHPDGAAAATLVLGIAAGYSRSAHRVLQDLYEEYTEAEQQRRSSSRSD